jgi:hypothetical protein
LFKTVSQSGARIVAIGDPRQSQAVGAGGLWSEIEQTAKAQDAFVELSRIVRAKDPADRREQALWRAGQHDHALTNYSERGFVVIEADQRRLEDRALDAAHADRRGGRDSLVVVETSNEQLDALNARAQAIRLQDGELGHESVPLTGRPYGLRAGDDVVVRAPVQHPDLGSVRNGVTGHVIDVDAEAGVATVRLSDGREPAFDSGLLDTGQVRLAYVSHPFTAQGRTTDTTHVIAGPLSTAEGSYVALTRAREHTHLYASSDHLDLPDQQEQAIVVLAQRLGRSEPDLPSIRIPLAHEQHVQREHVQLTLPLDHEQRVERNHVHLILPLGLDEAGESVARLRVERDAADRVGLLERDVERFRAGSENWSRDAQRYREELARMGPIARRGDRAREIIARLAVSEGNAQQARRAELDSEAKLAEIQNGPDSPQRWEAEHPDARERLREADQAFKDAVEREADRAITDPGEHVTRVLGERPGRDKPVERDAWEKAARAVEAYRITHQTNPGEPTALGPEPDRRDAGGRQHIDWEVAGKHVLNTREQLDLGRSGHGPTEERMARVEGLMPEQDRERAIERSLGREI